MVWFSFWSFISFVRLRAAAGSRRRQAPGGGRLRAAGSGQRQAPGGGRLWAATGSGRQTLGGVLFIVGRYILALGHCKASFDFITLWNLFFFFSSLKYWSWRLKFIQFCFYKNLNSEFAERFSFFHQSYLFHFSLGPYLSSLMHLFPFSFIHLDCPFLFCKIHNSIKCQWTGVSIHEIILPKYAVIL